MSSGNLATALTFSSHGCESTFAILFVSVTNRAAITISTGYTAAGSMIAISGSGCSAMGTARFTNSAVLRFAGADGGGADVDAGAGVASGTAPRSSTIRLAQKTNATEMIGFINARFVLPSTHRVLK